MWWDELEELAFGYLQWTNDQWQHEDVQILYTANRWLRRQELNDWKKFRFVGYTVAVYAGKVMKIHQPIERWYPLQGDKMPPMKVAKVTKMTRDETRERFKKMGFEISDTQLDKALHRRK